MLKVTRKAEDSGSRFKVLRVGGVKRSLERGEFVLFPDQPDEVVRELRQQFPGSYEVETGVPEPARTDALGSFLTGGGN